MRLVHNTRSLSERSSDLDDEKNPSGFFADGNKRTALVVAENVLGKRGYYIAADEDTIVEFMLAVASYKCEPSDIEQWLKDHVKTMEN